MKFVINIECDNAAFAEDPEYEVSRILREVAKQVEDGFVTIYLRDTNGNPVGMAEFTEIK